MEEEGGHCLTVIVFLTDAYNAGSKSLNQTEYLLETFPILAVTFVITHSSHNKKFDKTLNLQLDYNT